MNAVMPDRSSGAARWFYVWMALACVAIAFGGFMPTYWAKLAGGSFRGAPILHIHGTLFFAWTLFFAAQTTLVATGRTPNHRQWGLAGISLATAMGITVVLAATQLDQGRRRHRHGRRGAALHDRVAQRPGPVRVLPRPGHRQCAQPRGAQALDAAGDGAAEPAATARLFRTASRRPTPRARRRSSSRCRPACSSICWSWRRWSTTGARAAGRTGST